MATHYNSKIVTDGLILALDAANLKSFRGVPATNLLAYPYADWNGSAFALSYDYPNLGATYTYVTGVTNPINSPGVLRYFTGTSGTKYWAIQGTVAAPGTHTFSYYARLVGGPNQADAVGNAQLWRDTGTDLSVSGDFNPAFTTEWKRYATTGYVTTYLDYFPIHSVTITGGFTVEYCGFQLEVGSIATHFGVGTRGATVATGGGWVDLTNTNSTGADLSVAPVYSNSNKGCLTFNGSSTYLTLPNAVGYTNVVSVFAWFKRLGSPTGGYHILCGPSNLELDIHDSGFVRTGIEASTRYVDNYGSGFADGNWHYVGFTFNGSSKVTYGDGTVLGTATGITGTLSYSFGREIGRYGTGYYANGNLGTFSIYNRALTAIEVLQNFNAHRSRFGV